MKSSGVSRPRSPICSVLLVFDSGRDLVVLVPDLSVVAPVVETNTWESKNERRSSVFALHRRCFAPFGLKPEHKGEACRAKSFLSSERESARNRNARRFDLSRGGSLG